MLFSSGSSVLTKAELNLRFLKKHFNWKSQTIITQVQRVRVEGVMANRKELFEYQFHRSCPITNLEPGVFSSLINLVSLDLRNNELTSLDKNVFQSFRV